MNVLRRIFGHKRQKVTEGWRKLHKEELHSWHTSPNIVMAESYMQYWNQFNMVSRQENCVNDFIN